MDECSRKTVRLHRSVQLIDWMKSIRQKKIDVQAPEVNSWTRQKRKSNDRFYSVKLITSGNKRNCHSWRWRQHRGKFVGDIWMHQDRRTLFNFCLRPSTKQTDSLASPQKQRNSFLTYSKTQNLHWTHPRLRCRLCQRIFKKNVKLQQHLTTHLIDCGNKNCRTSAT